VVRYIIRRLLWVVVLLVLVSFLTFVVFYVFPSADPAQLRAGRQPYRGVFIFLAPGRTGLMPAGESGTQRGTDLKKAFPVGSELEVQVLEVEPGGKRIRLSRKALLEGEERDDAREFAERRGQQAAFGSIGDKLRAALAAKKS